jgi:hypothetical protein
MKMRSYPLSWPDGWQRTPDHKRKNGHFNKREAYPNGGARTKNLSIEDAIKRVRLELDAMGVDRDEIIISTNLPTRLDGLPKGNLPEPADRGVAVYWRKDEKSGTRCMAIDIYTAVADNLAAVAATLNALRAIERHGGQQVQERTFRGFAALPANTQRPWREVLQITLSDVSRSTIEASFRALAKSAHPDMGGSDDAMAELNRARDEALRELDF